MSDYLPFEIQAEIIKWLPVTSLLRFRSMSKSWKSLIDSSDFVARYQSHLQHILVSYEQPYDRNPNYVSIVDDHTFPQHRVPLTVPLLLNMLEDSYIIGSSHGLLCLIGHYFNTRGDFFCRTDMAVLWNLSIRRAVPVIVPHVEYVIYNTVIGFGFCPATADPKIVKIIYIKSEIDLECIPWQVEVFTLSTGAWRSSYSNLPRKSIDIDQLQVVVDGFLYWRATNSIAMVGGYSSCNLIISFDMASEEFSEVNLPDSLVRSYSDSWSMSNLKESLVVLQHVVEADDDAICLWMMEDGVAKSFVKLFTFNLGTLREACLRGFRKSGEPIIEVYEDFTPQKLVVYDPHSKHIDNLEINGTGRTCFVSPYVETLLLLDQPKLELYNDIETIEFLNDLVFSYCKCFACN